MSENSEKEVGRALKAHLAINVKDVNRSLAFYRHLWGLSPAKCVPAMPNSMCRIRH